MKAGWELKALGDITSKIGSGSTPRGGQSAYKTIGTSLIRSMNVHDLKFKEKNLAFIDDEQAKVLENVSVLSGDVFINITGASIARCCVVPNSKLPARVNQHVSILRPLPEYLSSEFLSYLLVSKEQKDKLLGIGDDAGATRQALTKTQLQSFQIPLPPLEEQKRIVSILDEAFEGLDRARENAEANLKSARELFEGQRKHMLSSDAEDWKLLTIDQICIVERGSSPRPIQKYVTTSSDGVNWIKIGDTKAGSKYVKSTKEKITQLGAEKSRKVAAGDFILTNSMTYGRPYIMATDGYIHDGWFALRLKDGVDSNYLFHALSSEVVQEQFRNLAAGAVVKNISGDLVKKTIIPIPPLEVQMTLAKAMDDASDEKEKLEASYTAKLQDISDLRQSLLQKAFAGELT